MQSRYVKFRLQVRIKWKVLRIDPEPVHDRCEERIRCLLQIQDIFLVPVEGCHALEKQPYLSEVLSVAPLGLLLRLVGISRHLVFGVVIVDRFYQIGV